MMSIQICVRFEAPRDHIDLHVPLPQHRVARGEQEHGGEQVPLDLEVGVRAGVEHLAHGGVHGADQHGSEDQPGHPAADPSGEAIDQPGQREEGCHGLSVEGREDARRDTP